MLARGCSAPCRANARGLAQVRPVPPVVAAATRLALLPQHHTARRHRWPLAASSGDGQPAANDDDDEADADGFEGLAPEEDAEVPGGYAEAMSASTRLGKAIRSACDELDALAAIEDATLKEADALLGKLGVVKGSLFGAAASGLGAEGGPRDALAALKRAMDEEAQAQAAHERSMAAKREAEAGGGEGGGGGK